MEWQRPKTTRLYLHPPKAERMFTLWREGKIIFGEIEAPVNQRYERLISRGVWFTHGGEQLDFHTASYVMRDDGIPVHCLTNKFGELCLEIESFASFERRPTCYIKVILKNETEQAVSEDFGFILRTGKESELIFEAPDVYASYAPDIAVWKKMPSTWEKAGGAIRDGEYFFSASEEFSLEGGAANTAVTLAAGEEKTFLFSFGKGERAPFDYEEEKAKAVARWEGELARINKLPEGIKGENQKIIKNLAVQQLQMFCYPVGSDELYARQGGLQRQIWTFESISVLESLTRLGDFADYIEPIFDVYFNVFQAESGEVVPFGNGWAMVTSNVLDSFGSYSMSAGKKFYEKYADKAYAAFKWIQKTRVKEEYLTDTGERIVKGLFPPMRCSDDPLKFQSWLLTDSFNIMGIEKLALAAAKLGDTRAQEYRAEYNDYISVMRREWESYTATQAGKDEIPMPYSPSVPNEVIYAKYEFNPTIGPFVDALNISELDFNKVINYYTKRGFFKEGLYYRMHDKTDEGSCRFNLDENGKCVVWYVCYEEYYLYMYFMKQGQRAKAEEIIRDAIKYAMTDEYYMLERYSQRDPWFAPWMPNASANGRMINMLLDFYK